MFRRKKVGYVSRIDKMLEEFDHTHPLSASQLAEIQKYERIYQLRDHPINEPSPDKIWDKF